MFFVAFVCVVALQMLSIPEAEVLAQPAGHGGGSRIGAVSSCWSRSAAALTTVPFLSWCNVRSTRSAPRRRSAFPDRRRYAWPDIFNGWGTLELPARSLGCVSLPALLALVPPNRCWWRHWGEDGPRAAGTGAQADFCLPLIALAAEAAALLF